VANRDLNFGQKTKRIFRVYNDETPLVSSKIGLARNNFSFFHPTCEDPLAFWKKTAFGGCIIRRFWI
jgi:hypothetical protein